MVIQRISPEWIVPLLAVAALGAAPSRAAETHRGSLPSAVQSLSATPSPPFLTPARASLVLTPDDAFVQEACRSDQDTSTCQFMRYGSATGGTGPVPLPKESAGLPHLHIVFVLEDFNNTLIAGSGLGVDDEVVDMRFEMDSSASSSESPDLFYELSVGGFEPGLGGTANSIIWQSVVLNGCIAPPPVIPVEFRNRISIRDGTPPTEVVGLFEAEDNTSLVPTGFWNFEYVVHASDSEGDASDFRMRGKVSVVCSARDEA